jgi:hypothetical protein
MAGRDFATRDTGAIMEPHFEAARAALREPGLPSHPYPLGSSATPRAGLACQVTDGD